MGEGTKRDLRGEKKPYFRDESNGKKKEVTKIFRGKLQELWGHTRGGGKKD